MQVASSNERPAAIKRHPRLDAQTSSENRAGTSSSPKDTSAILQALLQAQAQLDSQKQQPVSEQNANAISDSWTATPKQVIEKIQSQQALITSTDIETAVTRKFSTDEQALAYTVLEKMTRFANMKSLNWLQSCLIQHSETTNPSTPIHYKGEGTLGSTLNYLSMKHKGLGANHNTPFRKSALTEAQELTKITTGALLLDKPTKALLEADPQLCQHLRDNKITLLYPEGWDEGVNPFGQLPIEAMMAKLDTLLKTAQQIQENNRSLSEDKVIDQALSQPTRQLLQKLNLEPQLKIIKPFERFRSARPKTLEDKNAQPKTIANQLAPDPFTSTNLNKILDNLPNATFNTQAKQLVLEILKEQSQIYSPLRLSQALQDKHVAVTALSETLKIKPDSIFYWIGEKIKSNGLINYQYQQVNEINPFQQIEPSADQPKSFNKAEPNPKKLIVVLDDVASSGDSLLEVHEKITAQFGKETPVLISPVVSTDQAHQLFKDVRKENPNCYYQPNQIVPAFKSYPMYKNASAEKQQALEQAAVHLGNTENGLTMAFPYMAPDNNNGFFAKLIAPFFTLNGAGCKNIDPANALYGGARDNRIRHSPD